MVLQRRLLTEALDRKAKKTKKAKTKTKKSKNIIVLLVYLSAT